jgi:hypothetical protein
MLAMAWNACQNGNQKTPGDKQIISMRKTELQDKIKGGWAGQVIGCTYGGPTEFKFQGTMIQDYQVIPWPEGYIKSWYENAPGLYDDVYMDLTFVDVFDRLGLDAPVDSFAIAYATAGYTLWHANQSGRYNILNGIMPPASGHWHNNPHADCIDFQIEADFAGLMAPGMPNAAAEVCDRIGHIMNYGDGWYGGVYVAAMYSLAFVSDDLEYIVTEALKSVPAQSQFYRCISDVITAYRNNPDDWKQAWFAVEKTWTQDVGCPEGVFHPFNIDAKVNAAYIVIGLLYGRGDFGKTLDISTRCGQDSDCNPASAGGILGTVIGYDNIPDLWKKNLSEVEAMDFKYTTISLNDVYSMGYEQAIQMIARNSGKVQDTLVEIVFQVPVPVKFEESFTGLVPVERRSGWNGTALKDTFSLSFDGKGIVVNGHCTNEWDKSTDYVFLIQVELDGQKDTLEMPYDYAKRRNEIYWNYGLESGHHTVQLKLLNPSPMADVLVRDIIIYNDKPARSVFDSEEGSDEVTK